MVTVTLTFTFYSTFIVVVSWPSHVRRLLLTDRAYAKYVYGYGTWICHDVVQARAK